MKRIGNHFDSLHLLPLLVAISLSASANIDPFAGRFLDGDTEQLGVRQAGLTQQSAMIDGDKARHASAAAESMGDATRDPHPNGLSFGH